MRGSEPLLSGRSDERVSMFDRRFEDLLQAGIREDLIRRAKAGHRSPIETLGRLWQHSGIEGVCGAARPLAIGGTLLDELLKSVQGLPPGIRS